MSILPPPPPTAFVVICIVPARKPWWHDLATAVRVALFLAQGLYWAVNYLL